MAAIFSVSNAVERATGFDDQLAGLLPKLRRFANSLSHDAADADDLTQASIERGLRARAQWQEGTRLDSWFYKIMRNQWIDTLRSRRRSAQVEVPVDAVEIVGEDALPMIEASLESQQVMAAIQHLPVEHRELVILILVEGFGYAETARKLNLPIGTVSSRLVRARAALVDMIDKPGESPLAKAGASGGRAVPRKKSRRHIRQIRHANHEHLIAPRQPAIGVRVH